ncbi:aminoacyl-tRNA hydrolase [Noviherbaspirillum cavernae]|uniref:Aminoacyl-tRNA hydrolase n=1 Tax=Noviherbaspirillum cavernae TaxID=2320862 RepID=A0A418WVP7_9BURK|nr:aminoacyl-tRNA hydrolase [Noviherbaspirillum cavernae]
MRDCVNTEAENAQQPAFPGRACGAAWCRPALFRCAISFAARIGQAHQAKRALPVIRPSVAALSLRHSSTTTDTLSRAEVIECSPCRQGIHIIRTPLIPENEIEFIAIRAQGAGGQNVNKVSSAIHLRFDIRASSLPDHLKERLLALSDQRITKDGVVIIKAQTHRSQEKNKEEAYRRLQEMVASIAVLPRERRPTKPTRSSQKKRLEVKNTRGEIKAMRRKILD